MTCVFKKLHVTFVKQILPKCVTCLANLAAALFMASHPMFLQGENYFKEKYVICGFTKSQVSPARRVSSVGELVL